jgi:hypothetical protein
LNFHLHLRQWWLHTYFHIENVALFLILLYSHQQIRYLGRYNLIEMEFSSFYYLHVLCRYLYLKIDFDFEPLKQNNRFIPTLMNMYLLICVATVLGDRNVLKDRNGGPVQLWGPKFQGSTCLDSMKMCTKFHQNQAIGSYSRTDVQTNKQTYKHLSQMQNGRVKT